MKIAVFGLGYVGAVTATLLADEGHDVTGIDLDPTKVESMRDGVAPVVEPGLNDIVTRVVADGRLRAVASAADAGEWDIAFVCVGTPSGPGGQIDTRALEAVVQQLGLLVAGRGGHPVIVIRSTVAPRVLRELVVPSLIESTGSEPGDGYGLAVVPEFLREGTSVEDFRNPPFTLLGADDARTIERLRELFAFLDAPVEELSMGEAVMVKYASNAYHALKVAFANEVGSICAQEGLDGIRVMEVFSMDDKLNISAKYLRPGFAFGGSCLPKDLRELNHHTRQRNLDTPLLNAILPSNDAHLQRCIQRVLDSGAQRIGICGMSFKPNTDDLRESPTISLIETLIGKGRDVRIYDSSVNMARLIGTNRAYLEQAIPHISSLLRGDLHEVVADSDAVVLSYRSPEFSAVPDLLDDGQQLIDLSEPAPVEQLQFAF
jgi:GDP-mannose 6-dehydrogenase